MVTSQVLVFSDDIEWCRQQELFQDDRFMLSEYQELYSQTCATNDGRQNALIPYFDLCIFHNSDKDVSSTFEESEKKLSQ